MPSEILGCFYERFMNIDEKEDTIKKTLGTSEWEKNRSGDFNLLFHY